MVKSVSRTKGDHIQVLHIGGLAKRPHFILLSGLEETPTAFRIDRLSVELSWSLAVVD